MCTVPFLLVGGMTLFKMFEGERDMFLQRTHTFLEEKLSKSFGLELSFGQLRIGNFQEIVLEDLTFKFPEKENFLLMLPRVHLQRRRGATEVSFKEGHFLWGGKKIDRLKGQLFVSLEEPSPGPLALFERVHVEGMFQEGGGIQLTLRKRNLLAFEGKVVLQDFKWGERNFSGTGDILFLIRNRNHPWKDFKVKTIWHHLRLEEVPLDDLVGRFLIAQNTLFIEKLQWGNALSFSGETAFSSPYETSGRLRFLKLEREHLKHFVSPSKKIPRHVEGQFLLHGPLQKIHINGHLVSYEGRVKDIDYKKLNATLQGNWPIVRVELRVEREFPKESSLTVLGVMDLAELGRK